MISLHPDFEEAHRALLTHQTSLVRRQKSMTSQVKSDDAAVANLPSDVIEHGRTGGYGRTEASAVALTLVLHARVFRGCCRRWQKTGSALRARPLQSALNTQELHREIGIACYDRQLA